jgi:hypothetical protein
MWISRKRDFTTYPRLNISSKFPHNWRVDTHERDVFTGVETQGGNLVRQARTGRTKVDIADGENCGAFIHAVPAQPDQRDAG